MTSTTNSHHTLERRLNVKANYSDMTSHQGKQNYWNTNAVFSDRHTFPWSDRTLIYDPVRIAEPLNKFGVRFIDGNSPTQRYAPAGLLGQLIPKPYNTYRLSTMPVVNKFNTIL